MPDRHHRDSQRASLSHFPSSPYLLLTVNNALPASIPLPFGAVFTPGEKLTLNYVKRSRTASCVSAGKTAFFGLTGRNTSGTVVLA